LGSYGEAEVYVNALCDVVVRDADGVIVRTFTAGDSAPLVEVRSDSFTGAPYGGGSSAAGLPTTLQSILDLWETNAGSIDWKVDVNGTNYTLSSALSSAALGLVFNVKSTAYAGGAVGDGANNDAPAVSAAITACVAAGGGIVWFPPGTYRLNSSITVAGAVVLMGAGAGVSNILFNHSGAPGFDLSASSVGQRIFGLKFSHATSSAHAHVRFTNTIVNIDSCDFDGASTTTAPLASTGSSAITLNVDNCRFTPQNSRQCINTSSVAAASTRCHITRCLFVAPASNSSQAMVLVNGALISACTFDMSGVSGGTPRGIDGTGGGVVTGCRFRDAALGVVWYGIKCPESASGVFFMESGNEFGQGTDPLNGHAYDFTTTEALLQSRDHRWIEITESTTGNITLFMKEFGRCEHYNSNSSTGGITAIADSLGPSKAISHVVIKRATVTSYTLTFSTTWFTIFTQPSISGTSPHMGFTFMSLSHGSFSPRWTPLSPSSVGGT
jgi:hypothetical protein